MILNTDEENHVKLTNTALTQYWRSNEPLPKTKFPITPDYVERYVSKHVPVQTSKLHQMHSMKNEVSSGRRNKKSGMMDPPSAIVVAAKTAL